MLCVARVRRALLISALWTALAAPAFAATNIFMSITGARGPIHSDAKSPHGSQGIPIVQMSEAVSAPRDAASGQASGKRQHEPIKVLKEMDASSPQLQKAAATGEQLKEVVFQFYRTGAQGKEELYETIRLNDAIISSIQQRSSAGKDNRPQEEITFQYEKIEFTYTQQKQGSGIEKAAPSVLKPAPPTPR